jgi:ParB family chromosome partitioning protein
MQKALELAQITEGHARAILMVENIIEKKELFGILLQQKLSVRETEDLARRLNNSGIKKRQPESTLNQKSADIKSIENSLQRSLATKVEIRTRKDPRKGSIIIHFYSVEDFEKIVNLLGK